MVATDASEQAAWDAETRPHPRRRRALAALALGLAALLLLGALVAARTGGDGDLLALGSADPSSSLAPVDDLGSSADGVTAGDQSAIGPGDTVPGGGPTGSGPAESGPAAAGAAAAAAAAPGPAGDGVAGGVQEVGGPGAGAGVPVPTTTPGPSGSTASTVATTVTTQPTVAPPPPPPPPVCAITGATAAPNPVRKRNNGQLRDDVVVSFRPEGCGAATFAVAVKGVTPDILTAADGRLTATIAKTTSGWSVGAFDIAITGGGVSASVTLNVTS